MEIPNLPKDLIHEMTYIVRDQDTAKFLGSGDVEVLSTPAMIAYMENTALTGVQKYLPDGLTTVGIRVDVKHLAPAPKNAEIKVIAKLVAQDRRKLVFEVRAFWGQELIGEGIHERFIVDREKFLAKVKEKLRGRDQ